jgi:pimeloyl-ACP methyl ester carboxylesterase
MSFSQIEKRWDGYLEVQGFRLKIVFNIDKKGDIFIATFDSPNQNAYGLPVESVSLEKTQVTIKIPSIGAEYTGALNSDNDEIEGTFIQRGQELPLKLKASTLASDAPIRPQTPKKPYPYYCQDVIIQNKIDSIQLFGTLTLPDSIGKYPVAILISGSGSQDRDETIFGHKPFLVIADYLTKKGIGVLRFDDRHYNKSTEMLLNTTAGDIANDVESCVDFLQSHNQVLTNCIGLIGHSEGGLTAAIVSAGNTNIAFVVLLAGTGICGEEILLSQTKEVIEGLSKPEMEKQVKLRKDLIDVVKNETDKRIAAEKLRVILNKDLTVTLYYGTKDTIQEINNTIKVFNSDMFRFFVNYDPKNDLQKIACPVLALIGEKDKQVLPDQNLTAIELALKKGKNNNYLVKEIPNVNHLFQTAKTGKVNEYAEIEETISPAVLALIADWIIDLKL